MKRIQLWLVSKDGAAGSAVPVDEVMNTETEATAGRHASCISGTLGTRTETDRSTDADRRWPHGLARR